MAIEKPITDYEGTVALIKEIKKADAENASNLTAHESSDTAHPDIREAIPYVEDQLIEGSHNCVENGVVKEAMDGKQDALTEMTQAEVDGLISALGDL